MSICTRFNEFLNEGKISIKDKAKFIKKIEEILKIDGFEKLEDKIFNHRWYKTSNVYGKLELRIDENPETTYSIFMRFVDIEDNELAKKLADNKYSGKRNIHCSDLDDAVSRFVDFLDELDEVESEANEK